MQHRRVDCVCTRGAAAPELDRKVSVPTPDAAPPSSLLLIHDAGSGHWVFDDWLRSFPSMRVAAVDLLEGLDVASASMSDYAERVVAAAGALPDPVALCAWSMGGLVALQAAARVRPYSVILIETSPPAEVQGLTARSRSLGARSTPRPPTAASRRRCRREPSLRLPGPSANAASRCRSWPVPRS